MYDVIIVGVSFAGLAVASQLDGFRVLLIGKNQIGSHQTSACGTALPVIKHWGLENSVLQTHDSIVLHTKDQRFEFPSPYQWCTFDYEQLCKVLFDFADTKFIQAIVTGYRDGWVETNRGRFTATCIVDASGWQAILASSLSPGFSKTKAMNFGIETIRPLSTRREMNGLHFWYDPEFLNTGMGWVFPRGETVSYGLGSYRTARPLKKQLKQFTRRFNIAPDGIHGTHFPSELRKATMGSIFLVGDAAGMCTGFTGEGIRPALFFGETCGRILRRVLVSELSLQEGLAEYDAFVESRRYFFAILSGIENVLTRIPPRWIDRLAKIIQRERARQWVFDNYWKLTKEWTADDHVMI